ncbi:hypothetical protein CEY16_07540 [Halalkalibacillus sediminis]|uniref:CDP-glycerol--glycerophosphate glycerophosphotransferase n=1 Tax=Halalkalibacillus sediminis TaxID=2018042 RepID=A0A2I0QTU6_9BACI|nr:CDP-glycerol glycerophosphotransferase family protein [Halalkalibacillus sediminis]PKR77775.1 hypothetical protein CEY16_07540 [Halalkalibacillus sediminis]
MRRLIKRILSIFCSLIKIKPSTFLIIESSFPSGSNTKILAEELWKHYTVDTIHIDELYYKKRDYIKFLKQIIKISQYEFIVTSHGFKKYNPKQIVIDLWHGTPLKAMRYMEKNEQVYEEEGFDPDHLITSSKLESSLLAACMHVHFSKHEILGSPRNDYLFKKTENEFTNKLSDFNKVLLYMPTFRSGYLNRKEGEVDQSFLEEKEFISYLESNNYLLITKFHPLEEKSIKYSSDHIMNLTSETLLSLNIDLYQVLPHTDLLITDYSSIYFDYLLLDRPIIFLNKDIDQYRKTRGLLLEPYDFWTPGIKVQNDQLISSAINQSFDKDEYKKRREELRSVFHLHQDGKSTERVVDFISDLVAKRGR